MSKQAKLKFTGTMGELVKALNELLEDKKGDIIIEKYGTVAYFTEDIEVTIPVIELTETLMPKYEQANSTLPQARSCFLSNF
jgi:hypothetical protein